MGSISDVSDDLHVIPFMRGQYCVLRRRLQASSVCNRVTYGPAGGSLSLVGSDREMAGNERERMGGLARCVTDGHELGSAAANRVQPHDR